MSRKSIFYAVFAALLLWFPSGAHGESSVEGFGGDPARAQIRAFVYHHFGEEDRYPSTSVSVNQFEDHLDYLEKNDYTVITLGRAMDLLDSGEPVPEKTAVITIDDAYKTVMENAVPLLKKHGYRATVFVPTSHAGGSNYLDWKQLAKLHERGFEIGNHSDSHEYFLNHPEEKIAEKFEDDLVKSHVLFQKHLGFVPDIYAYPFGEYHPDIIDILKRHGYRAAAAQKSGVIHGRTDRFILPRFPMNLNYAKMDGFSQKIGMHALGVVKAEPENPMVKGRNPPVLRLTVKNSQIRTGGIQCFVSGSRSCRLEQTGENGNIEIRVASDNPLETRRSLYTITAPSKDGAKWFWYSYLWIIPEYGE